MPWYNQKLTQFLELHLQKGMNIFEYGCGFSTLYYAQKGCSVFGVECNPEWKTKVEALAAKHNLAQQINICLCKPHQMPAQIHQFKIDFNVIVVDSMHRLACLKEAKIYNKTGIIVLDNAERPNLQTAEGIMQGYSMQVFEGPGINRIGTSQAKVFVP